MSHLLKGHAVGSEIYRSQYRKREHGLFKKSLLIYLLIFRSDWRNTPLGRCARLLFHALELRRYL